MDIKQVIVLRKDLGMSKGKLCAQAARASMKVFFDHSVEVGDGYYEMGPSEGWDWSVVREWVDGIFTEVVVGCGSEGALMGLYRDVQVAGLPCALVEDAGLMIPTCIAIGPAPSEDIDRITGKLPLL